MPNPMSRAVADEQGSMPLAILASIVVLGLVTVLLSRTISGEHAVRFDRAFTEDLHAAEAGIDEALFRLNAEWAPLTDPDPTTGLAVGKTSPVYSGVVDGIAYEWSATRTSHRSWDVTSTAEVDGTARTLVATIEERSLFYPGAFGDQIIALNGTSTEVDSYNSDPSCVTPAAACGWGTSDDFGTGNGSLGTNGSFDWTGNTSIRPGGGFLYDWADNPGADATTGDPFGDRCDGNRCTDEFVRTVDEPLEFDSPERMAFITSKFASDGACADPDGNPRFPWGREPKLGTGNKGTKVGALEPYAPSTGVADVTAPSFENFYCADTLEFLSDIELADSATPDDPVVFFVKDFVKIPNSGTLVACHDDDASTSCNKTEPRNVTPRAARLQIYVAGEPSGSGGSSNVTFKSQSMFAGVLYAPKSRCGAESGGGGADVYGLMVCGSMDNVGNWDFHFDDDLGRYGTGEYDVAFWREETPTTTTP